MQNNDNFTELFAVKFCYKKSFEKNLDLCEKLIQYLEDCSFGKRSGCLLFLCKINYLKAMIKIKIYTKIIATYHAKIASYQSH